ncbi:MAG: DEAD/DEAH box helicase [Candidatus Heimdallarchaeota archaeon]|nr:MAG: DEAD/DEAH box helicase [Candidatus Heimdallarchaeota archaeon]
MSDAIFNRFPAFIQEWIYSHGWEELREIQVASAEAIFNTKAHVLLATGTASGKTEAAFFPALTLIYEDLPASIGILYISPLKALINDQFSRIEEVLEEAEISAWPWHGDIPRNLKRKLLENPNGVLQITPESMESLLINRQQELRRMFGDLRFVIIDEVHVFMNAERGTQILCQLERLGNIIGYHPRRIGLSATLSDYSSAEKWLSSGTNIPVNTPKVQGLIKRIRLAVENFIDPNPNPAGIMQYGESGELVVPASEPSSEPFPSNMYLFDQTLNRQCLVFTNTRERAESTINALRAIADQKRYPNRYYVHHGSISASLREEAESIMKTGDIPSVTACSVTLELGIDIGSLERIIQIGSPRTVSSFLQRLGRSGRKEKDVSEILFIHSEDEPSDNKPLPYLIPWELIQSVAIINLYLEERWIEPIRELKSPFSLLYHQTMSSLASAGELSPQSLAQRVLSLTPFKYVSQEDYRTLIRHLIELNHIEQIEDGGLIVGLDGERVVRNYRFYAVFPDVVEWTVKNTEEFDEIGKVGQLFLPSDRFPLAGYTWEVKEIYPDQKVIIVAKVGGRTRYFWPGGIVPVHTKVLQKMREILFEEKIYPFLQPGAVERIQQIRTLAREVEMDKRALFQLAGHKFVLLPWAGSISFRTIRRILELHSEELGIRSISEQSPYFFLFEAENQSRENLELEIKSLCNRIESPTELIKEDEIFVWRKFDQYIPTDLQQQTLMEDYLDLEEVKAIIKAW